MRLDLDQMRAAWIARFGTDWIEVLDIFEDDYFYPMAQGLIRLDSLDVNLRTEEYRIKLPQ